MNWLWNISFGWLHCLPIDVDRHTFAKSCGPICPRKVMVDVWVETIRHG